MDAQTESRAVTLTVGGQERIFDIDLPELPDWIEDNALKSGGFPYDKKLSEKDYEKEEQAEQDDGIAGCGTCRPGRDREDGRCQNINPSRQNPPKIVAPTVASVVCHCVRTLRFIIVPA